MSVPRFGSDTVESPTSPGYAAHAPWLLDALAAHRAHEADLHPEQHPPTKWDLLARDVRLSPPPSPGQRLFWPDLDTPGEAFARGAVHTLD